MTVKTIFETMEYGTAPESPAEALGWLAERGGRFGHFIGGAFTEPAPDFDSRNPASGADSGPFEHRHSGGCGPRRQICRAQRPAGMGSPGRARPRQSALWAGAAVAKARAPVCRVGNAR